MAVFRSLRRAVPPTIRLLAACAASLVLVAAAVVARGATRSRRPPVVMNATTTTLPTTTLPPTSPAVRQPPVSQIALPTGLGCADPHIVSPAPIPAVDAGRVSDEAFLSAVRNWFGGEIDELVLPPGQFNWVELTATNPTVVRALASDQAFVGAGAEPEFGRALVPHSTAGSVVDEAVAIPFPEPADAARFDNTYIATSCANQFPLAPVTPGGEGAVGGPTVTSANTAGLVVALTNPVYGHPDALMAHAVVGDWLFIVIVYTDVQVVHSGDAGVSQAMAAGLAAIDVDYRLNT